MCAGHFSCNTDRYSEGRKDAGTAVEHRHGNWKSLPGTPGNSREQKDKRLKRRPSFDGFYLSCKVVKKKELALGFKTGKV